MLPKNINNHLLKPRIFIPLSNWLELIQLKVIKMEIKRKQKRHIYSITVPLVRSPNTVSSESHQGWNQIFSWGCNFISGSVTFHDHSGCWQNAVSHECRTEVLTFLLSVNWGSFLEAGHACLSLQILADCPFKVNLKIPLTSGCGGTNLGFCLPPHVIHDAPRVLRPFWVETFIYCLFLVFGMRRVWQIFLNVCCIYSFKPSPSTSLQRGSFSVLLTFLQQWTAVTYNSDYYHACGGQERGSQLFGVSFYLR